jgi:hypothetical protein
MRSRHLIAAAVLGGAAVLSLQPLAEGQSTPQLNFVVAEGAAVTVPKQSVTDVKDYDVRCPKNYVATGFGVSLGTTQLVFADPDAGGKGYSFAFLNTEGEDAKNVSATVICMRGRNLRVKASALSEEDRRQAVGRARESLRG